MVHEKRKYLEIYELRQLSRFLYAMEKLQLRLPGLIHLLHQFRHTFRRAPIIQLASHPRELPS
jgi:hypothetical protein